MPSYSARRALQVSPQTAGMNGPSCPPHRAVHSSDSWVTAPHAAVGCGAANPAGVEGAVDRMARWAEEDGMRHRRVVPLLREMVSLHAKRRVSAARRVMAELAGGYGPNPPHAAVDRDHHALGRFVDRDEHCCASRRRPRSKECGKGDQGEARDVHQTAAPDVAEQITPQCQSLGRDLVPAREIVCSYGKAAGFRSNAMEVPLVARRFTSVLPLAL